MIKFVIFVYTYELLYCHELLSLLLTWLCVPSPTVPYLPLACLYLPPTVPYLPLACLYLPPTVHYLPFACLYLPPTVPYLPPTWLCLPISFSLPCLCLPLPSLYHTLTFSHRPLSSPTFSQLPVTCLSSFRQFRCCGGVSYREWGSSRWREMTQRAGSVPDSCCKTPSPGCGARDHPSNIWYTVSTILWVLGAVMLLRCNNRLINNK